MGIITSPRDNGTRLLALLLAVLLLTQANASAFDPPPHDGGERVIVLAAPPKGWPPYIDAAVPGKPDTGLMLDILREIAALSQYRVEVVRYPELRSRMLLAEGAVDAYPSAKEWLERPDDYLWTDPVLVSEDVLAFQSGKQVDFDHPDSLAGLRVGLIHGFTYPGIDGLCRDGTFACHTANNTELLLSMVSRGHLDAAVTNRRVAEWTLRNSSRLDAAAFDFSQTLVGKADFRFAFISTRVWAEFIGTFNAELARMKADGRLERMAARYR
jgi:ABC-type amino acid transport/signal transduction systems, periplasmic component/domain